VHITRLAYADEASIRLLVTPDGAGELVAGEENGTLPAGENADLKWTITVLQGARISCQVLSSQGSLLGGDSLDVAGGPTPVPTLDGAGLLQADRTATRAPSAPTAMISISYALCFRGETGSATYPCRNAYYELWKLAGGIESKVRSGYADGNGLISLTNVASGNLSLRFYANDGSTCKVDAGGVIGTVYGWTSGYGEILVNEDFTLTVDDSNRGVWAAYSTVQDGYNWLKTETGWSRSQVRVQWPVGDWPQSNGNNIFLTNVGSYANSIWGREVVLHEYAHCIQYALPGGWPPWSWGGSHYIYTESDRGFALLEGWAEFFPCAVDDSAEFMGYDLESDQFADVLSNGDWDGEIVEGAVAAIMWDIFDGVSLEDHASYELSGYGDRVDGEFAEFWRIFSTLEPLGMDDVWGEWTTKNVDLWAIFYSSRVNKDVGYPTNPTGADEAPSSDSWSDGMEVTITLTGASDDLSGIWGFHYRWASSASDPTGADFYAGTSITSVLEHDQWVLSVRAVDRSGRVASGWTFFAYYSDAVAPSNPSLVTSDHLISRWSQERTIGMQWSGASDALSGVKGYSVVMDRAPTTLPDSTLDTSSGSGSFIVSDGLWYFHLRTVDNANNWAATAVHMGPFWIDNGDPDLSASLTGALGLGGFYVGPVAVTISAHDAGSGVDEVEYREGSDPWTEYAGSMIVTGDGAHHIEVRVTDLAGNGDSLEFELHIDTTRPTAPSSYDSTIAVGEWNNGAATNISWSGMEDEGGILGFSYLLSEDPIALPDELVDATFSSLDEMALPEGAWYLNVRSADRAGHFSAQALSIGPFLIDRAAPSTSLLAMEPVPESGWYTGPVAFALSASDALSGVQVIEMRVDGGEWMTMTGNFTFSQEGGHTLEHRSRDLAGNFAPIVSYDLAIDMTPPAPPLAFLSSLALGHYLSSNQTMLSWRG
jgi:hypothetical protein